jgi:hypothetical protein
MSDGGDSAPGATTPRRWYEREPLAIWLPLAAMATATIQTVAYAGYKFFYGSFGVRPQEVGYDYTSLIPTNAFQLALITSFALLLLGVGSVVFAIWGVMLKPIVDDLRAPGTSAVDTAQPRARLVKIFGRIVYVAWLDSTVDEPAEAPARDPGLRPLALAISSMIGALAIVNASGLGASAFLALWLVISLVLLLIGHLHARDKGRPERSVLSSLLAPRAYRGSRRLIVIGLAASSSAAAVAYGPGPLLAVVAAIFVADRVTPVVDVREEPVPGGGRSRWLRAVTILGSTGLIVLAGLLFALPAALRASNLDHKVQQVLVGSDLRTAR